MLALPFNLWKLSPKAQMYLFGLKVVAVVCNMFESYPSINDEDKIQISSTLHDKMVLGLNTRSLL